MLVLWGLISASNKIQRIYVALDTIYNTNFLPEMQKNRLLKSMKTSIKRSATRYLRTVSMIQCHRKISYQSGFHIWGTCEWNIFNCLAYNINIFLFPHVVISEISYCLRQTSVLTLSIFWCNQQYIKYFLGIAVNVFIRYFKTCLQWFHQIINSRARVWRKLDLRELNWMLAMRQW